MPIYKGRGETLRAIHACLTERQETPFTLLAINDRSPDPVLAADLAQLAARGLFLLVDNEKNLGFVRSVNRGLSLRQGKAVVLLNSDAQVFGNWLDRLVSHAETKPRVGSVTPLSNNATICSYPRFNANNTMRLEIPRARPRRCGEGDQPRPDGGGADRRRLLHVHDRRRPRRGRHAWTRSPSARATARRTTGACAPARRGSPTFWPRTCSSTMPARSPSASTRAGNTTRASRRCSPSTRTIRASSASSCAPIPDGGHGRGSTSTGSPGISAAGRCLFVTHSWGGGIQRHIEDMIARLQGEGTSVVLLSIDRARSLQINVSYRSGEYVYLPTLESLYLPRDAAEIAEFVGWLDPQLVHVHSLAGLRWSAVQTMMQLVAQSGRPYAWTLHDFSPVCHRNHLVMPDGDYCGLAAVPVCRGCLSADAEGYEEPDPEERRTVFGRFLAGAARVFAPSPDTAARIAGLYPDLPITVRPHFEADRRIRPSVPRREGRMRRISVLGAINTMKGARFLQALATDALDRQLAIRFSIVGYSDPALTSALEAVSITETGRYASDDEALDRVARDCADIVLLPAIWPETYSYALTLGLRTGLPVVAFDLGAQGERLSAYPNGHVLPYALLSDPSAFNDRLMQVDISPAGRLRGPIKAAEYDDLMRDYYALDREPVAGDPGIDEASA